MPKPLPTPEELRKLLRYEPDTGLLFWRERTPDMFKDGKRPALHSCNNWNSRYSGEQAGVVGTNGYVYVGINYLKLLAHRVIWAMETGEWPADQIDHENHVRSDNRFDNLGPATNKTNGHNQSLCSSNKSGFNGVCWDKGRSKWIAAIMVDGKHKHLGRFDEIAHAVAAREKADSYYNFHTNHGVSE